MKDRERKHVEKARELQNVVVTSECERPAAVPIELALVSNCVWFRTLALCGPRNGDVENFSHPHPNIFRNKLKLYSISIRINLISLN